MGFALRARCVRLALVVVFSGLLMASECGDSPGIHATVLDKASGEPLGAVTVHIVARYSDGRELPVAAGFVVGGQAAVSTVAGDLGTPGPGFAGYDAVFERRGYVPGRVSLGANAREAHAFKWNDATVEMVQE